MPANAKLTRLRMYASRFGSGYDPETTYADLYIFDTDKRMLQLTRIPYSLFTYQERWVDIPLNDVRVPERFWVLINAQAHQYKGIYVHYDKDIAFSHSMTGRIPEEMQPLSAKLGNFDWMIRAYVEIEEPQEEPPPG